MTLIFYQLLSQLFAFNLESRFDTILHKEVTLNFNTAAYDYNTKYVSPDALSIFLIPLLLKEQIFLLHYY